MASTYQSALIDQLDPTLQKKPQTQDDPMTGGPIANTGFGGGNVPIPMTPKVEGPTDASNGGFAGPDQSASTPAPIAAPAAAPNYSTPGAFQGAMRGFNADKLQSKSDPKYDVGRVLSQFDPKQGITPDVLNALNGLGEGTFALKPGSKDYLTLSGNVDPRWNGMTGADAVFSEGGPDAAWTLQGDGPGWNQDAQQSGQGGGGHANPIIQGSPTASINQALSSYGQPSNLIQQLIAQLQGGG
jgi:hypothetical protein